MLNFIVKLLWPIVFKLRKYLYPYKLKYYSRHIYSKYNCSLCSEYNRGIILMFDEHFSQGGFVDRIKGIVSSYYISKKYNVDLKLYFSNDIDPLISIIKKNSINITTDKNLICYSKKKSKIIIWYNYFPTITKAKFVKINENKQLHLYTNMNVIPYYISNVEESNKCWSGIFNEIFSLPKESYLMSQKSFPFQDKIGIHLRFMDLLGDFKDIKAHSISDIDKKNMLDWCIKNVFYLVHKHNFSFFFILSDSKYFLDYLQNTLDIKSIRYRVYFNSSDIGHTATNTSTSVFNKTLLDFMTLSDCSKVYQLRYGKMHKSDFSKYASLINDNHFELFESI